jgi:hypothetical protein
MERASGRFPESLEIRSERLRLMERSSGGFPERREIR